MKTIALIIMVAAVLESLVEYAKTVGHMIDEQKYKTAITQCITIIGGIFFAFAFHLQLFNGALSEFYDGLSLNPVIDMVITGILFSRGSNYISDLVGKLTRKEKSDDFYDEEFIEDGDEDGETEEED